MSAAAAAAAPAVAEASPAKKSFGKKKLIVMVAAAALVLGGAGIGGLLYVKKQRAAAAAAAAEEGDDAAAAQARADKKKAAHKDKPVFIPMDAFVVNLADHDADRYAQIGITLEVPDDHVGEEIKTYLPAIRNNILLLLAHKSSADLAGGQGKELLAREIRREALRAMGEDDEEPVPVALSASAAAARKAKGEKEPEEGPPSPIRSVQFSSFIIQ